MHIWINFCYDSRKKFVRTKMRLRVEDINRKERLDRFNCSLPVADFFRYIADFLKIICRLCAGYFLFSIHGTVSNTFLGFFCHFHSALKKKRLTDGWTDRPSYAWTPLEISGSFSHSTRLTVATKLKWVI